jgi:DNA topoisomerase I
VFLGLEPRRHETQPPARYTEAALIKELEQAGIGRPSTYASIIKTIQGRGYVFRQGRALVPSFTAFAVTHLLRQHFSDYVDVGFTAEMEEVLDAISNGEQGWLDFIRRFYRGDGKHVGLEQVVKRSEEVDYPVIDLGPIRRRADAARAHRAVRPVRAARGGRAGNTASLPDDIHRRT